VRLVDRTQPSLMAFDAVRQRIEVLWRRDKVETVMARELDRLRGQASITVDEREMAAVRDELKRLAD